MTIADGPVRSNDGGAVGITSGTSASRDTISISIRSRNAHTNGVREHGAGLGHHEPG